MEKTRQANFVVLSKKNLHVLKLQSFIILNYKSEYHLSD